MYARQKERIYTARRPSVLLSFAFASVRSSLIGKHARAPACIEKVKSRHCEWHWDITSRFYPLARSYRGGRARVPMSNVLQAKREGEKFARPRAIQLAPPPRNIRASAMISPRRLGSTSLLIASRLHGICPLKSSRGASSPFNFEVMRSTMRVRARTIDVQYWRSDADSRTCIWWLYTRSRRPSGIFFRCVARSGFLNISR